SDKSPDSVRYAFISEGLTFPLNDSEFGSQNWFFIDNRFSLNGYLGKAGKVALIEAGIANKTDRFGTNTITQNTGTAIVSNYIFGNIKKEAQQPGQWSYNADAEFYFTGRTAGNFLLRGRAGKSLGEWISLTANLSQVLTNAPFAWESFKTNYYERAYSFGKISWTQVGGDIGVPKLKLWGGIKNHLIANYLYYDSTFTPQQQAAPFS